MENIEPLISTPKFKFYKIDISSDEIRDHLHKNDIIFHFAAIAPLPDNQENPRLSFMNNVSGTAHLLEVCRLKGVKHFFLASTSAIYENNTIFPSKESDSTSPTLLYSLGKKFCEELCRSFNINYGIPYTVLRLFNVYGPHNDCLRKNPPFIAYIIRSFLEGKQPLLHSNGKQRRDYIFIEDLLDLLTLMVSSLNKCNKKTYNICSGETASVEEIVATTQKIMNTDIQPIYREPYLLWEKNRELWQGAMPILNHIVEKEVNKYSEGSYEQALNDFGWRPKVYFKHGLELTVASLLCFLTKQ
jgi:nucleoside-diphosphate-sugar epimerase